MTRSKRKQETINNKLIIYKLGTVNKSSGTRQQIQLSKQLTVDGKVEIELGRVPEWRRAGERFELIDKLIADW